MKALVALFRLVTVLSILFATQTSCSRTPADGTVIKRSTGQIYLIENRYRRQVPDLHSLLAYGLGKSVSLIPDAQLDAIKLGPALPSVPSAFIMNSAGEIFHLEAGKRRQFETAKALASNYPGADVRSIPDGQVQSIPLGLPITEFEKVIPQRERAYDLKVIGVSPAQGLLEHQAIQVRYQLDVREVGLSGDLAPAQLKGFVCPADNIGTCSNISELQPNQTFTGDFNAFAPSASNAAPLNIKLVTEAACNPCETLLAVSEDFYVPIAARYEIAIDSFDLEKPRSKFNDTVKISLRSGLQGHPIGESFCQVLGGNFCRVNIGQGDFGPIGDDPFGPHTSRLVRVGNVRVGSFDLVPEVSDNLVFQYDVENLGHENQTVLDSISQAAGGILDALLRKKNIDTLGGFAAKIQGLEGCDGPVAVDGRIILNKSDAELPGVPTLDSLTRERGLFTPIRTQFEGPDSQSGCGENSRYRVTWSIYRTSWKQ
jgi:hypothetical protein